MSTRDYRMLKEAEQHELTGKAAIWLAMAKSDDSDFQKLASIFPEYLVELHNHFNRDPDIQGNPVIVELPSERMSFNEDPVYTEAYTEDLPVTDD